MGFLRALGKAYRWYPPRRFLFYPLYKYLRRSLHLSMSVSNFATWTVSAVLHAAILLPSGSYVPSAVFGAVFLTLGLISSILVFFLKQRRWGARRAAG